MPRPGPRPYECIRRAWHSDSHQPLRGSLIQEIFRVVNELHSTNTRRKKEWQEKLPTVVLRAEEILYSKANSESEYMDVKSLRSRLEDAVNTMIRREDSDESGPYLEPCVEAALSLGCPPRKTPRGQRQGPPRLCANVGRRSSSTSVNPGSGAAAGGGKCGDGGGNADSISPPSVAMMQEAVSSSTYCALGAQVLARQDACQSAILSASAPIFTPIDTPPFGVGVGYTLDANAIPRLSGSFPRADELSHNLVAQSFPNYSLAGFLKAVESRRQGSFPVSRSADTFSEILSNVNQEGRVVPGAELTISPGTRMDTDLFSMNSNRSICSSSTSTSNLPQMLSTEGYVELARQTGQRFRNVTGAGMDSARSKAIENNLHTPVDTQLQLQIPSAVLDGDIHSRMSTMLEFGSSSSGQRMSTGNEEATFSSTRMSVNEKNPLVLASAENVNTASSMDLHDLQLRLGPPGKAPLALRESVCSEQLTSRPRQQMEEASIISSLNDYENNMGSCWNRSMETLSRRKGGLNVDLCPHMSVIDVDLPAPKRLRSEAGQFGPYASSYEDMLRMGSGLSPSMQFTWPRW